MRLKDKKIHYKKWQAVIEEQQASGLTQKEFCKQKNIDLSHFVYYRCQLKKNIDLASTSRGSFLPVKISDDKNPTPLATPSEIKVLLPNGFQCIFISNLDVAYVKQFIQVLSTC